MLSGTDALILSLMLARTLSYMTFMALKCESLYCERELDFNDLLGVYLDGYKIVSDILQNVYY